MYDEQGWWSDLDEVLEAGIDRVLIYGPPGTGKTVAAMRAGASCGDVERIVCSEDMTSGEVTGMWMPGEGGLFQWHVGPAIRAWSSGGSGGRLVLDEVDRASGDAMATILAAVDSRESATWRDPQSGNVLRPGEGFSVIATTNVESPSQLDIALLDRFPVRLRADRPHPEALALLDEDLRMLAIGAGLAPSSRRLSLRSIEAFALLRDRLGVVRAAELVIGRADAGEFLDALAVSGA